MRIQWCEVHESKRLDRDERVCERSTLADLWSGLVSSPCQMVDKQLADGDDLVVKDALVEGHRDGRRTLTLTIFDEEDGCTYDHVYEIRTAVPTRRPHDAPVEV